MSGKRLNIRFDLESERDRRVWERLQAVGGSKSKAVVSALDACFSQEDLATVIRQTIRECLRDVKTVQGERLDGGPDTSEEDLALLDSMEAFMGL